MNSTKKKCLLIGTGLLGITIIILVHEMGHFCAAHWYGVPTPVFSLGFGPALFQYLIGNTLFQISLFPLGGYVDIDNSLVAAQPYLPKMIIVLAGIAFNFLFAALVVAYFSLFRSEQPSSLADCVTYIRDHQYDKEGIIGPIGIISLIGNAFVTNIRLFWLILALISLNIGLFNLLPLPFFDGGKAVIFTIQALSNNLIPETILTTLSLISLALFAIFISVISINEIKKYAHNQ